MASLVSPYDVPLLKTERLILRKWSLEDAEDMFAYASDPEVTRYAMWPRHKSIEDTRKDLLEAQERYRQRNWAYWGLELRETGQFVGSAGFVVWREHDRNAELGYALSRSCWGKGLMTEAIERLLEFGWSEMQLHRMEAKCILANRSSVRRLESAGFQLEGIRREAAWTEEEGFLDVGMYGLLRAE